MTNQTYETWIEICGLGGRELRVEIDYDYTPGRAPTMIDPPEYEGCEATVVRVFDGALRLPKAAEDWFASRIMQDRDLEEELLDDVYGRAEAALCDAADARREIKEVECRGDE